MNRLTYTIRYHGGEKWRLIPSATQLVITFVNPQPATVQYMTRLAQIGGSGGGLTRFRGLEFRVWDLGFQV